MNVELSSDASNFIDALVSSGNFRSPNEAVAEGIRLLMSREKLRSAVRAGIEDADAGHLVDATDIQAGIDDLEVGRCVDGETMFAELRALNSRDKSTGQDN